MLEEIERLYPRPALHLNSDELALLDWVLHYPLPNTQVDLAWHMRWDALRERIWGLLAVEFAKEKEEQKPSKAIYDLIVEEEDVPVLLAIVPTTFRWGAGADCGFSLKVKLYWFLHPPQEKGDK